MLLAFNDVLGDKAALPPRSSTGPSSTRTERSLLLQSDTGEGDKRIVQDLDWTGCPLTL